MSEEIDFKLSSQEQVRLIEAKRTLLHNSECDNPQVNRFVSLSLASGELGVQLRVSPAFQGPGRVGQN